MKLFKWLKDKAGKMPISITQAAGLTAVVGAAGFAAMSYLSSPADNNTTFIPPSAYEQSGDVVYISQNGGGGQYEANGEVGSSFRAAPSRSIQLANQQAVRERQARELEDANVQPTYAGEGGSTLDAKAYQLGGADVGLGMGTTADKQLNGSLEMFNNLQNQLAGVSASVNNAVQAGSQSGTRAGAPAQNTPGATSRQTAAQLANAPRNWGQGGVTRAGSGNGVSNTFTIQNSGKNPGTKEANAALAQVGNVVADAQAAMANLQREGTRMRSQARFGNSAGLGADRDAAVQEARRRYGNAKSELEWIRKQSAEIAKNKTNEANAGGRPFLASTKISGGLMVDGSNVTTGQGSSSADLSTADRQMRGVKAKMQDIQTDFQERTKKRHDMRKWMWWAFPAALVAIPLIARLRLLARTLEGTLWGFPLAQILNAMAVVALLLALTPVIALLFSAISYAKQWGGDGFSTFAEVLSGVLTGGLLASFFIPVIGKILSGVTNWMLMAGGAMIGLGGATAFKFLSEKGDGYTDAELNDSAMDEDIEKNSENLKGEHAEGDAK